VQGTGVTFTAVTAQRLTPGDPAPDFSLPDAAGNPVSLRDYAGRRVIVYFYPAAMTPGCTTQACDFQESLGELETNGFAVLGISPDPPAKLARFADQDRLDFPLLSDPEHEAMTAYAAFGEKMLYGKVVTGVIRSTFVVAVDAQGHGRIEIAQYAVKATGHVARLRRELGME